MDLSTSSSVYGPGSSSNALTGDTNRSNPPSSVLKNAHDFVLKDAVFVSNTYSSQNSPGFDSLARQILAGAEFDSSQRDPPPRCHPGTRTTILHKALRWLHDPQRNKPILWLSGSAGVGKSAIMQTLAERESDHGHLAASLFLSRSKHINDPLQVFPSLAYQIAVKNTAYRAYIDALLLRDPRVLDKSMSEQFKRLIIEPFARQKILGSGTWLMIIDGLDECGGRVWLEHENRDFDAGRMQCEITQLIHSFTINYPFVPLVWAIASRPEAHLKTIFSRGNISTGHWREEVPVDTTEACEDVERYLRARFLAIRHDYPDHIPQHSLWPSEQHLLALGKAASGLFAFASTAIQFIEDPLVASPVQQLEYIVEFIDGRQTSDGNNPLNMLDALYTRILQSVPQSIIAVTLSLLAFSLVNNYTVNRLSFRVLSNILGLGQDMVYSALRKLHAVLDIPTPSDALINVPEPLGGKRMSKGQIRARHASFTDYLQDRNRSGQYCAEKFEVEGLWNRCFHILQLVNDNAGCDPQTSIIPLSWPCEKERADKLLQREIHLQCGFLCRVLRKEISIRQQVEAVERMDFSKLAYGYFSGELDVCHFVLASDNWTEFQINQSFEQARITRKITLAELKLERIRRDRIAYSHFIPEKIVWSIIEQYYRDDSKVTSNEDRGPHYEKHFKPLDKLVERLRLRQTEYPHAQVELIGNEPHKSCAVLVLDRGSPNRFPGRSEYMSIEYYILPYSSV